MIPFVNSTGAYLDSTIDPRMMTSLLWLGWVLLILIGLAGLFLNIVGLPGIWLIVVGTMIYGLATGWDLFVGTWITVTLVVIGLMAELIELLAGAAGAKKFGGSNRGMIGAIVGGLIGGIVLTPVIPIPIVGTILGSIIGTFVGAFLVESGIVGKTHGESGRAGVGAAIGRTIGIVVKTGFGLLMFSISVVASIPITDSRSVQPVTMPIISTTMPSTQPTANTQP